MKPVIGVTGLPCSGKSHAAKLLASGEATGEAGALVKADDLGHEALTKPEIVARLRERFGDAIAGGEDPSAMRRRIAAIVFADPAELAWLEALIHPAVAAETDRLIAETGGKTPVVVEAALLFAAGMERRCDRVIVLEASFETRLRRALARGWDREELERRDRRQLPLFEHPPAGYDPARIRRVRNDDDDDDGLGARIADALS